MAMTLYDAVGKQIEWLSFAASRPEAYRLWIARLREPKCRSCGAPCSETEEGDMYCAKCGVYA